MNVTVAMMTNVTWQQSLFILTVGSHLSNNELSPKLKQQNWYILFLNNNQRM